MKARHLCAIAGMAIAVGSVTFMQSLVKTNDHQSEAVVERLLASVPVEPEAEVSMFQLDYRPGGHVMQGPPMTATVATDSGLDKLGEDECVVTRALFAQRRLEVPPVGSELVLIGRKGAHRLKIAAVRDWERPLRGYPNVFVNAAAADSIDEMWMPWEAPDRESLQQGFMSDAGRNFNRAKGLLLWAAALTALCLLVNSLFLSIEARRRDLAILRMLGKTRGSVALSVMGESVNLAIAGLVLGIAGGLAVLYVYVASDAQMFPLGMAVNVKVLAICAALSLVVAAVASLVVLRPALAVRPLEAAAFSHPRKRHLGMIIAFACGFGAFVAVETWGGSLMSAFVPSPEWPDAIVSILPGGVSSFDIDKLRGHLEGVKKIHELAPLQVNLLPLEELKMPGRKPSNARGPGGPGGPGGFGRGRGKQYRNALLLGSDWLPDFKFIAGDRESAQKAIMSGDNCIITAMMARARKLKLGDELKLDCGMELVIPLKIVGIVDLNWHMVTSRGLVRGLNRMPGNTDGPVFVSFDTVEACDRRPAPMVKMTHLWLDYDADFLSKYGVFECGRRVEKSVVSALGLVGAEVDENTVRLHARDEIADGTLAHGVDIIGSMARVPFIFIAVISLGLIAMLVASAESRKREFAVLRAVGATKWQLSGILVREAMRVALIGLVIGVAGGALAGWLFTAGTRAAMASWGIPPNFAMPLMTIAKGAAGAIVFALLVAVPASGAIVKSGRR